MGYKKLIVKISPNTSLKSGDYIIDSTYGLCKALNDSSGGRYNQVVVELVSGRVEKTLSIFNGDGLYKISINGDGIGSNVDLKKAIRYLFKN